MKLPTKHQNALSAVAMKDNEIIDFIEYFIRNTEKCCTCNGVCPKHPHFIATRSGDEPVQVTKYCEMSGQCGKDNDKKLHFYCDFCGNEMDYNEMYKVCEKKEILSLAQKFQAFREKRGNGQGKDYWTGLEDIANEYYHQL